MFFDYTKKDIKQALLRKVLFLQIRYRTELCSAILQTQIALHKTVTVLLNMTITQNF